MSNLKKAFDYLLFFFFIIAGHTPVFAQVTVSADNTAIKQIILQIEKNNGYSFFYSDDALDLDREVTVNIQNESIEAALNKVFAGTNIRYAIGKDKQILLTTEPVTQLSKKYFGIVTDANYEEPITGASIAVKGTRTATFTDVDGKFSIEAPAGSTLLITYIGYAPEEVKLGENTDLRIIIQEAVKSLDEVVVVGYGTTLRKNLTTAISTVKTENIAKSAVSNVSQMLLGRAAGLQATISSPQPDGYVNLSIRGQGTPIFIVDGIMMPAGSLEIGSGKTAMPNAIDRSGLTGLNPSDIESIEVLKDAAAAIYGIGSADGVILITTKKGTMGVPKIVYDANFSIVQNMSYLEPLNAQDYMNIVNTFGKENYLLNHNQYPYGNVPYDNQWTPLFSAHEIEKAQTTDWLDCVLKTGYMSNHNITITGGTEKFKYYLGGNYYNYKGSIANAGLEKYTLRTNISSQLFPFLKLTAILNLNQNNYLNSSIGPDVGIGDHGLGALDAALSYPSNLPIKDADGQYTIYRNFPNPEALLDINDKTKTNGYYVNLSADINIIKNMLTVKLLYGINSENGNRSLYIPSDLYFSQMYKSRGNLGYTKRANRTLEATASFQKEFGSFLRVDAVVGVGQYFEDWTGLEVYYENVNDQINSDNIAAADGPFYPTSWRGANEKRSQFGRVSFDFLDRYTISGTLRRDGTDKFFPDSKYALFPSISAAWKISEESFLKNVRFVNLLKLRISYGKTGRDNLGTAVYGLFSPASNYIKFNGNAITYIPYLMNGANYPDVGWEKSTMKNIGLDFSLLNDRISGGVDVFRNDNTRLLGTDNTAPLSLLYTRPVNGGHYKREGWETTINTMNIKTDNFQWNTTLTLSHYSSIWIERMSNYDYTEYQIRENEPMNRYYYYNTIGVINMDKSNMPESQKSLPTNAQLPGCPIIEDKNNDGIISIEDVYMEDLDPDIYIGFGNRFVYKNFDLDVFLYGQFGISKYNMAYDWANPGYLGDTNPRNTNHYAFLLWNSQTNPNSSSPGIAFARMGALPGAAGTNIGWQDASFVRVRNITLGYNLEKHQMKAVGRYISNLRLFVDIQNPFVITGFDGIDPEIRQSGGGRGRALYPQTRTYSLGLKVSF
jgi:TonB-linked SusC/RagA family outer membrane protein